MEIYINGLKYECLRDFMISEQLGNKSASEISVEVTGNRVAPMDGDIVEVRKRGVPVFWGTCGIPRSPQYCTGHERHIYSITCGGANNILARRIINEAYSGYTVAEIVQSLYDSYIAEEGITLGKISQIDKVVKTYTAKDYNLQDALNELADLVGATWKITPQKEFIFVSAEDFPALGHIIDANHLIGGYYQHTVKDHKVRSVQYISGATDTTSEQTEQFVFDGESASFSLAFPVAKRPTVCINGVAVDPEKVGINGLDTGTEAWFFYSFNSSLITYNAESGGLAVGDTVTVVYTGIFPIRVVVQNDAMISSLAARTGLSGKREAVENANGMRSEEDAIALAKSLLDQFSAGTGEVKFRLLSSQLETLGWKLSDTDVLMQYTFDLPQIGITGTYVIVERTLTPHSADTNVFMIKLRLTDRDYLKSYGETISTIRRDTRQLAIRDEDTVIKMSEFTENITVSEMLTWSDANVYYPSATEGIFAPSDLGNTVYPI